MREITYFWMERIVPVQMLVVVYYEFGTSFTNDQVLIKDSDGALLYGVGGMEQIMTVRTTDIFEWNRLEANECW